MHRPAGRSLKKIKSCSSLVSHAFSCMDLCMQSFSTDHYCLRVMQFSYDFADLQVDALRNKEICATTD